MNLYLISQDINNDWDTYDSAVVAAESEDDARTIHPDHDNKDCYTWPTRTNGNWVRESLISKIKVEYLGPTDKKRGLILASFNAG